MLAETLRPIRTLDVFAGGCGGWSLGLRAAGGFETVAMCEIEPDRRAMLAHNFPGARLYDDVQKLTAARLRADGIRIDAIVGSGPCQDGSAIRQKARGIEGEKTRLIFEQIRLADETGCALFGTENSNFLIRRGGDRAFSELEAIGFTVWPLVLPAECFGAPIQRERLFCIAWHPERLQRLAASRAGAEKKSPELAGQSRQTVCGVPARSGDLGSAWGRDWIASLSGRLRRFDGVSSGLARRAAEAYGDAIVPQISEACGHGFKAVIKAALIQAAAEKNAAASAARKKRSA